MDEDARSSGRGWDREEGKRRRGGREAGGKEAGRRKEEEVCGCGGRSVL